MHVPTKSLACFLALLFLFSFVVYYQKSFFLLDYFDKIKIKGNFQHQNSSGIGNRSSLWFKYIGFQSRNQTEELPLCPEIPPNLGPLNINTNPGVSMKKIISENTNVQFGGHGKPQLCQARQKIAIIIPFRNREPHLKIWLHYMHPFLTRQEGDYGIYVVEQTEDTIFNRAKLMNVGYTEALKDYDYTCFIFSDVDIIPMDQRNLYRCSVNPRHMANSLDKFNFQLPYAAIFGGIVAFTKEQFLKVNGFSNVFWGWGGEDDELYNRVVAAGMRIERPEQVIARSKMITHNRDTGNERTGKSFHLINEAAHRMHKDGLSSLDYTIIGIAKHRLYTKVTVDIGNPENN